MIVAHHFHTGTMTWQEDLAGLAVAIVIGLAVAGALYLIARIASKNRSQPKRRQ